MGHVLHYVLIVAAVFINRKDRRMLALSLLIGLSILLPVGSLTSRNLFWFCTVCITSDLVIGLVAFYLNTRASNFVLVVSAVLCAIHVTGWWFGGWLPESPYRVIAPLCEYAEIVACSVYPLLPDRKKNALDDLTRSGRGYRKECSK